MNMKNKKIILVNTLLNAFGNDEKKRKKYVAYISKAIRKSLKKKTSIIVYDDQYIKDIRILS